MSAEVLSENPTPQSDARLRTESNRALIERAVKGSVFYPVVMLAMLLATEWSAEYPALGWSVWAVTFVSSSIRFVYLKHLLRHPASYTDRAPRPLPLVLLTPSVCFGAFAALSVLLFGTVSMTAVVVIVMTLGFAAGGTSSLAMDRRMHLAFLATLLLPYIIAAGSTGTREGISLSVLAMLFVVFMRREGAAANAAFVGLFERGLTLQNALATLESKHDELTRTNDSMKLVLDNIEQGLCIVDTTGVIEPQTSRAFDAWFGAPGEETRLPDHFDDEAFGAQFEVSLDMLAGDILPPDVVIDQLPRTLQVGERHMSFGYRPIERDGRVLGLLVVATDETDTLAAREAEREQRELVKLFQLRARGPVAFHEFRSSSTRLVGQIAAADATLEQQLRALHTLKGNAGVVGVESLATLAHTLEDELAETRRPMNAEQTTRLEAAWAEASERMHVIAGRRQDAIEISTVEHQQLLDLIASNASHAQLSTVAESWTLESVPLRFESMARRARQLAGKLDKTLEIQIDVPPLRLARERWGSLWTACIHLITNAVDHGIEPADARETADKQPNGQLSLSAHDLDGEVVIRVRDDGRGIDWARVSEKAEALGLPAKGKSALQDALFATGMSTRDNVTTTSGRGVGLSALAAEAHALGGRIEVESTLGEFTEFRIRVPKHAPATAAA